MSVFASWDIQLYDKLSKPFNVFYRKALKHLPSFPTRLLFTSASHMGLSLPNPTDVIQTRKWRILQRLLQGTPANQAIGQALIGRATRLRRLFPFSGQAQDIHVQGKEECWIWSLLQWLERNQISTSLTPQTNSTNVVLSPAIRLSSWASRLNLFTLHDISQPLGPSRCLIPQLALVQCPARYIGRWCRPVEISTLERPAGIPHILPSSQISLAPG